jgi:anti-sigma factor ChrR (cupin superfamily)
MISDELEALALADSVGALDPGERAELAARLAELSPEEQAQVARLYDAATAVADSVELVVPAAHVRARVLAAARTPSRYTVHAGDADWFETGLLGIQAKVLAVDHVRALATLLIRAEAGAVYPSHRHHGPEECYVIRGSIVIDGRVLRAGDFHHADADSDHGEITTVDGAEVLIVGAIEDYLPGH